MNLLPIFHNLTTTRSNTGCLTGSESETRKLKRGSTFSEATNICENTTWLLKMNFQSLPDNRTRWIGLSIWILFLDRQINYRISFAAAVHHGAKRNINRIFIFFRFRKTRLIVHIFHFIVVLLQISWKVNFVFWNFGFEFWKGDTTYGHFERVKLNIKSGKHFHCHKI